MYLAEEDRISVAPSAFLYHDKDKYTVEIELPGVRKEDIEFEATTTGFCLRAPRDEIEYVGCWMLAHSIDPEKATASFSNGLLTVSVPLAESFEGVKVPIK